MARHGLTDAQGALPVASWQDAGSIPATITVHAGRRSKHNHGTKVLAAGCLALNQVGESSSASDSTERRHWTGHCRAAVVGGDVGSSPGTAT